MNLNRRKIEVPCGTANPVRTCIASIVCFSCEFWRTGCSLIHFPSTDHLLSYFLGNSGVSPTPPTQYTTTSAPPAPGPESPLFPLGNSGVEEATNGTRPSSIYNNGKRRQHGFSSTYDNDTAMGGGISVESRQDPLSLGENDDDDAPQPPPTPAIQHYFPSSSNKHKNTSLPAPSVPPRPLQSQKLPHPYHMYQHQHQQQEHAERLESMNAIFLGTAGGHPSHQNHPSKPSGYATSGKPPSPPGTDEVSPISPAGWIGPDHEPMLFPSPNPMAAETRQSHLEWLRQINALAHQANNGTTDRADVNAPAAHYMVDGLPAHSAGPTKDNGNTNSIPSVDHEMPTVSHPIPSGAAIPPPHYQQHPTHQQPQHAAPSLHHPTIDQTRPAISATAATQPALPAVIFPPPGVPLHPTAAAALAAGNPIFFSHAAAYLRQQASSPVETEEKRAKRLERNRESARKSRRRKKERLSTLGEQVSKLLSKVEKERRIQMGVMDDVMMEYERNTIVRLKDEYEERGGDCSAMADEWLAAALEQFIDRMGDPIRKDVVEFQCTALGQYLLPRYQKFLLWLTLHPESYFMVGKDEHAKRESTETSRTVRTTPGKISSKQIGDELTNGRKLEDGTIIPPSLSPPSASTNLEQSDQGNDGGEKAGMTAQAFDAGRMWPLTCFELSISVDQEDKFLQSHKRYVYQTIFAVVEVREWVKISVDCFATC